MKRILTLLLAALALSALPAGAGVCALDNAPGATLLLPYFEVDLSRPNGRTTLMSINNAASAPVLTHLTVWSDLGVPVLGFNLYLTGYDVETLNLRDVLNGVLPRTASTGQDPQDQISPDGPFSTDLDFPSCLGILPLPQALPAVLLQHLRDTLTGRPSLVFNNLCAGQFFGDEIARGYVTVDTVSRCSLIFPTEAGYFGAGGVATNQNVLWGDFFLVDAENNFAQGENLVRLEADPNAFHNGDSTFYGRFVGYTAADAREPLASVWASRFVADGAFTGGTEYLVWRDSGRVNTPFLCNGLVPLSWYPLAVADLTLFDEQETPEVLQVAPIPEVPPSLLPITFPAEANRVKAGGPNFPVPFNFGWVMPDFGRGQTGGPRPAQAWVQTLMSASGKFSVGYRATPLIDVCHPNNPQFPQPGF